MRPLMVTMALVGLGVLALACNEDGDDDRGDSLTMEEYFEKIAELDRYQATQSDRIWGGDGDISERASPDAVADLYQREIDVLEDFRSALDDINPPGGLEDMHDELVRALGGVTEQFDELVAELRVAKSVDAAFGAFEPSDFSEIDSVHHACRELRNLAGKNNISVQYARPRIDFACSFAPHPGTRAPATSPLHSPAP